MEYSKIKIPSQGNAITFENGMLKVPDNPIIPFIEGDGSGVDIWETSVKVLDAAVQKAYHGIRKISWMEVFAGEKSNVLYGPNAWLPEESIDAIREFRVAIKGPMTTQIGGGVRSINVALRQLLDLYVCLRPIRYFKGVPSPVKKPEDVHMTIFRENTEDIYTGIEFEAGSPSALKLKKFLEEEGLLKKVRFPDCSSFGIKPVSKEGTKRLMRAAIRYAIQYKAPSVTIVHKGNIMKYTEGYFVKWAYEVAKEEFAKQVISWEDCGGNPPAGLILIKDVITDAFLQQILTRPSDYSVIATMNLSGDYISDALAAQVGGTGIAPGANINYESGHAIFEATHGTALKYAGLDKVNPSSLILSGVMMFRYLGWNEAADMVEQAVEKTIAQKTVTYDFARFMDGAKEMKCSEFGEALIRNM